MATQVLPGQIGFPFVAEPNPVEAGNPTELHNIKKNKAKVGQLVNTVRRGSKWANVLPGWEIYLTEGPHHICVGVGRVERVWTGRFIDVPAVVLDRNHSGPQSYSSVLAAMREAYGDGFRQDEYVVFLDYTRIR